MEGLFAPFFVMRINTIDRSKKESRVRWLMGMKYMTDNWGNDRLIFTKNDLRCCAKPRRTCQKLVDTIYYDALKNMNESWIARPKIFNSVATYILTFSSQMFGHYPHFLQTMYYSYICFLSGFSVTYYLSRIVRYKLGIMSQVHKFLKSCPRRHNWTRSYRRGIRYKRNWHHKKKKHIRKKRSKRSLLVESASSAFTTVLNADERISTRDLLIWLRFGEYGLR